MFKKLSLKLIIINLIFFYSCLSKTQTVEHTIEASKTFDLSEYPVKIGLPKEVNESSGVEYHKGYLYTFNDSGGKAEIYKLNPENGKIVQTIKIKNATNVDWEEVAIKGDTLFIGDFGNNLGNRKNLTIYSILLPPSSIEDTIVEVEVEILNSFKFQFEDQTDYISKGFQKTDFDCEAFVYYNNKLHLFTKEWLTSQTTHYVLDIANNNNTDTNVLVAKKMETFTTDFLVTSATLNEDILYLLGYTTEGIAYLQKFIGFTEDYFFTGKNETVLLGLTAAISQVEGIAVSEDKIFITGEEMEYSLFHAEPSLYVINKNEL